MWTQAARANGRAGAAFLPEAPQPPRVARLPPVVRRGPARVRRTVMMRRGTFASWEPGGTEVGNGA